MTQRSRTGGIVIDDNGCWIPQKKPKTNGYIDYYIAGAAISSHRLMYELWKGPIPSGLHIDHLCRNHACCNPDHLEAVTCRENILRGNGPGLYAVRTHCTKGHEYTPENTYMRKGGGRACRRCQADATQRWRETHATN